MVYTISLQKLTAKSHELFVYYSHGHFPQTDSFDMMKIYFLPCNMMRIAPVPQHHAR